MIRRFIICFPWVRWTLRSNPADSGYGAVLLGPIWHAATHGYDTIDYRNPDPRLGTWEDLEAGVCRGCHGSGVSAGGGRALPCPPAGYLESPGVPSTYYGSEARQTGVKGGVTTGVSARISQLRIFEGETGNCGKCCLACWHFENAARSCGSDPWRRWKTRMSRSGFAAYPVDGMRLIRGIEELRCKSFDAT
jgi:hypothetical protein